MHPPDAWSGLLDTARRIGHHLWVERQLFEWLGAWSRMELDPEVTAFLGEMSARHGWHAELLFARLPELREVDAERLVVPGSDGAKEVLAAVCLEPDPSQVVEALAGYQRVLLPVLLGSYRELVAGASPVADASLVRWLGFVVGDDVDEWLRGDALVRSLLGDADGVRRAAERQRELEHLLQGSTFPC
jgi:hypothetical protein